MNAQRKWGIALVSLQAAALAYCFGTPLFATAAIGAALIGGLGAVRLASPAAARRWPIALVVLYLIQRTVVPPSWYSGASSFFFRDSCLTAQYFLIFQVAQFFVRREDDRLPSYLPILAIVTLSFTGDFHVQGQARQIFQAFSMGLVAVCALYFAANRRSAGTPSRGSVGLHRATLAAVLLVTAAAGWAAASGLYHYWRDIESAMGAVLQPSVQPEAGGFSGSGRLGSVAARQRRAGAQRIALRAWADGTPGYLRGRAFDTYSHGQWQRSAQRARWLPVAAEDVRAKWLPETAGMNAFLLGSVEASEPGRVEIWSNQPFDGVLFVPLRLAALQAPVDRLSIDAHAIVESEPDDAPGSYVAWTSEAGPASPGPQQETTQAAPSGNRSQGNRHRGGDSTITEIAGVDWQQLVALPDDLDPGIVALAQHVAEGAETAAEKIAAVQRYFRQQYQYRLGIDVPPGADPVEYFLLEKPPAHCEFFASGAAVLLRALGVPCRYVTGFVVAEKNEFGGYWVARNRDAHAWVEAYDPQRGWVLVEPTPSAGVPQATSASRAGQLWDALRVGWQRLVAWLRGGGLRAALIDVMQWLLSPWGLFVLLAVAAGWYLRWLHRRRRHRPAGPRDPEAEAMRKLLLRMDRRWRKAGLERRSHETLHQFADRLDAAADAARRQAAAWYRRYAAVRYSGSVDGDHLRSLQEASRTSAKDDM